MIAHFRSGRTMNSTSELVALDSRPQHHNHPVVTLRRILFAIAGVTLLVISWRFAELRPSILLRPETARALWNFAAGLFPPDVSPAFVRIVLQGLAQTMAVAIAGTFLSIVLAVPLGILATATLWKRGTLAASDKQLLRWIQGTVSRLARAWLGFLRAVPDLVWALLFVAAVGLGPLAGTLALTVGYTGVLGRVYADVFEHVDPHPLEALQSTGASRMQILLRGVWPQALPHLIAYTLYSFECAVRAAAVLGFVGAGGIGYELNVSMRMFEYGQVLTILIVLVLLLLLTDTVSCYMRARTAKRVWLSSVNAKRARSGLIVLTAKSPIPLGIFLALPLFGSFAMAGFTPESLSHAKLTRMTAFIAGMLPPDLTWAFISSLGTALLQTVGIAFIGTVAGIALAVVLAVPATSTLVLVPRDSPTRTRLAERGMRWIVFGSARLMLNILRSIPELVWVLICILAVGVGPFAGTIALGMHTAGVLGKLFAETLEEVPLRPVEALRSLGARRFQLLLWAMWPQARPLLSSYSVLRWETNLRASTILGLVGGGGLGQAIYNNVQLGFYPRLSTLILLTYALVLASDWIGERLRLSVV
jgi:phosphonate transport system permease protein